MVNSKSLAEDWLSHEDEVNREGRLIRLQWMAGQMLQCEYIGFQGGLISKYVYEEARYCYAYGQFLATIVLGLAFIEHSLAALFHTMGRDDLERAPVSRLILEALNEGWIDKTEFDNLDHAREIRNPITHFRNYMDTDRIEWRSIDENNYPYAIIEEDAQHVMETIFRLMKSGVLCHIV